MENVQYTDRVRLDPDGVFRWRGHFNTEQRKKVVKICMGVCGGMCLFFVLLMLIVDIGDGSAWLPTLLSCAGVMLIAGVVCFAYYRLSVDQVQPYEMTEESIRFVGSGQSDARYRFDRIVRITIYPAQYMMEIRTALSFAPFFVPPEDFSFVQTWVLQRVSDKAEIIYK